ncbi:MAG: HD superfamily phosphohydrolase [Flavobacteriales bacterium]
MSTNTKTNKRKILNDPIYGFISILNETAFDIIEHPYFQRLRRISQLGLTYLVYPGAYHTRFHHAIGAAHLMQRAISVLRSKGVEISEEEGEAVYYAILLHDIGHGPFSHALEHSIVNNVSHEKISILFMRKLNEEFEGKLDLAITIFQNKYPKKFLHQLISSQLDMDRMDYLRRDSFYSGVSEGIIGVDRIISMLNVCNDQLVVEAKAVYSIEKYIMARTLMYWQVYLHKTVLVAEFTLLNILKRAKEIAGNGAELFSSSALKHFLYTKITHQTFLDDPQTLDLFARLDDFDIMGAIKEWQYHSDPILSQLSKDLIQRNLSKIEIQNEPFDKQYIENLSHKIKSHFGLSEKELNYYLQINSISVASYDNSRDKINLLYKDGSVKEITDVADQLNMGVMVARKEKHFVFYPKI